MGFLFTRDRRNMAFIPDPAPYSRRHRAGAHAVDDFRHTSFGSPANHKPETRFLMEDISSYPTPGKVFADIGRVIAVCLALGVLARILVAIVG